MVLFSQRLGSSQILFTHLTPTLQTSKTRVNSDEYRGGQRTNYTAGPIAGFTLPLLERFLPIWILARLVDLGHMTGPDRLRLALKSKSILGSTFAVFAQT